MIKSIYQNIHNSQIYTQKSKIQEDELARRRAMTDAEIEREVCLFWIFLFILPIK